MNRSIELDDPSIENLPVEELEQRLKVAEVLKARKEVEKLREELIRGKSLSSLIFNGISQILQIIAGFAGLVTGYFAADIHFRTEREEVDKKAKEAEVSKRSTEEMERQLYVREAALKRDQTTLNDRIDDATLKVEIIELKKEKESQELIKKQASLDEKQASLSKAEAELEQTQLKTKEEQARSDAARNERADQENRKKDLEEANRQLQARIDNTRVDLSKIKPNPQLVAIQTMLSAPEEHSQSLEKPSPAPLPDIERRIRELFDENTNKRGAAYAQLISADSRERPELPPLLMDWAYWKVEEFNTKPESIHSKSDRNLLWRGLENTLVTLRDISRSVTQPPTTRSKIEAFANYVKSIDDGSGDDAESLLKWLKTDRNKR